MRKHIDLDDALRAHPQRDDLTPTVIDLDRVLLTPAVVAAWNQAIQEALPRLRGVLSTATPTEQGRVWSDNRLQIFVTLPENRGEVTLDVPPGQWTWRVGRT